MVRGGEGIKARGRPPRRLQLKQWPPLAPLIALGTPGPGPPSFPLSSRAVGPGTSNHKAVQRPDRGLTPATRQSWEHTLATHVPPGDRLLTQLRPPTVTRAGDSLAAAKCRGLGVADSSACRESLKKAEGGGDTRVRRVRPSGVAERANHRGRTVVRSQTPAGSRATPRLPHPRCSLGTRR